MKYRKLPIVVDAEQWFPGKTIDGVKPDGYNPSKGVIQTLEGNMSVSAGDWIVTGIKNEKWPVKLDIFLLTYEAYPDTVLRES